MKKIFLLNALLLFAAVSVSNAQATSELWGVTSQGGDGYGVVFKVDENGNNQVISSALETSVAGTFPNYGQLCEANGLLYGIAGGGPNNMGIIYSWDPLTNAYTQLIAFNGTNGQQPQGGLIKASNGKLYGVTELGGTAGAGVLYEYTIATNTLIVRKNFGGTSGNGPTGGLIQASNGKIYGTTSRGGSANDGVIFEFNISTNVFAVKQSFNTTTRGEGPSGAIVQANGKLYGVTSFGGTYGDGVLYEYNYTANTFSRKYNFNNPTGGIPFGGLAAGNDGILYGLMLMGGANDFGTIYEYDPVGNVYTKTFDFDWTTTGAYPKGAMTLGPDGNLYGFASEGGTGGVGVLFQYAPTVNGYEKKLDFYSIPTGGYPMGSLLLGSNNIFYGFTSSGGEPGVGTLFTYDVSTEEFVKEIEFDGGANGAEPRGSFLLASNGKLYSTASYGGSNGQGTLFEIDPSLNDGTLTKLVDFSDTVTGFYPRGCLMQHSNGKIYGTADQGGIHHHGVLFEYDITTNTLVKKVEFDNLDGNLPMGNLVEAPNGKLYGVTLLGGLYDKGTIYEFDPATGIHTKLFDFAGVATGAYPRGGLTLASNGKFYGTTSFGDPTHRGVLYEYDYVTNTFTKKYDFVSGTGVDPYCTLSEAPNGMLYGTTQGGGAYNFGVIFEYDPATNTYTKKYDFMGGTDGTYACGQLTLSPNGKFYGGTQRGGTSDRGTLFEYDYVTNAYVKKIDFNNANGAFYFGGLMPAICPSIVVTPQPDVIPICAGSTLNLNSGSSSGTYTYQWYLNSTAIPGATSSTYSVSSVTYADSGFYYCQITNSCRTANTDPVHVLIDTVHTVAPTAPGAISGPADVCPITGTLMTATYSIAPVSGSPLYYWVVPAGATIVSGQGTDSIHVKFPSTYTTGQVKVQSYYTCGSSSVFSTLTVNKTAAATPGTITGQKQNLCPSTPYTYSVAPIANATSYTWTVPTYCTIVSGQGTNTLTVTYSSSFVSGSLSVKSVNHCSSSAVRTVSVVKKPTTPGAISGIKNVCAYLGGAPLTYSITPVSGITTYNWTVPSTATIVSGQGTNSIQVAYSTSFTTGNISVVTVGTCVNSAASTIAVTWAPLTPGTISGDATVCSQITSGTQVHYSIAAVSGATSYFWLMPTGATLMSGQGTTSIYVLFDSTLVTGTQIKVRAVNACTNSAYKNLALTSCAVSRSLDTPTDSSSTASNILLYPNPTGEMVSFDFTQTCSGELTIEIYDAAGKLVRSEQYFANEGENHFATNVSDLESGIYFLRVVDPAEGTGDMVPFVKE